MSVVTIHEKCKLPLEELKALASSAGLTLNPNHVDDWSTLLGTMDQGIKSVLEQEDYTLTPDLTIYPRTDISIPSGPEETDKGGWASRCLAKCTNPKSNLLQGKTIALKDNVALAGVRCTNGTEAVAWTPQIDATIATRIMDASGVIIGKAACENGCMEGCSDSSCTGPVHNPYADNYSCGGSSSGSGRLVATGSVDLAIGGDQGGSIRIPASMCGIVGLKPTWGLVPYSGILSLESTIDHTGPMAKTCRDAALLLDVIAGPDGIDDRQPPYLPPGTLDYTAQISGLPSTKPLDGVKIGLLTEAFESLPGMNPSIAALVRRAADQFTSLGATLHEVSIPMHSSAAHLWSASLYLSGGRTALLNAPQGRKQLHLTDRPTTSFLPQEVFDALGAGAQNLYLGYLYTKSKYDKEGLHGKCTNLLRKLSPLYDTALSQVDVLLMPTLPCLPCPLFGSSSLDEHGPLARLRRNLGLVGNTAPFDSTGHPAVSVPCGFLENEEKVKLPVGMQIVGKKFEDGMCLRVGAAWEGKVDWKTF